MLAAMSKRSLFWSGDRPGATHSSNRRGIADHPCLLSLQHTGDPELAAAQTEVDWADEANLDDVHFWLAAAEADPSNESVQQLLSIVPPSVISQAIV